MQNYIETEADTVEEAIESALTQLNATREQVSITIINEPTKGIPNFGAKPAKISAALKEDVATAPETILKEILIRMGIDSDIESNFIEGSTHLNMITDTPALLIGKHGKTLDAIEYLINCIINKNALAKKRIFVDTEGYWEWREQMLVDLANQVAAKVKRTQQDVVLEPMSPKDRRVIHLALQDDPAVSTYSQGEGDRRRVVITSREYHWVIAPMQADAPPEIFTAAWEYDKQHGTIAVGRSCDDLGLQDVSQFKDVQEFQAKIKRAELGWGPSVPKTIWDFHREIQVNDIIIARRGLNEVLGIGIVKESAHYNFDKGKERIGIKSTSSEDAEEKDIGEFQSYIKPRFLGVSWIITGNFSVELKSVLKSNKIVQQITNHQYQDILVLLKEAFKNESNSDVHKVTEREGAAELQKPKSGSLSETNYYIGIDLGTTNSAMAWGSINPKTKHLEPKIVPIERMTEHYAMQKKTLLPSCVYFDKGQPPNIGEYAKEMLEAQPHRVVESIKRQIGTQDVFEIEGTLYTPTQILSLILKYLSGSAKSPLGFSPDNAVITVPAYFDKKMRDATIEAARLAGFRTTDENGDPRPILLDEPYAILYDRINREIRGEIEKDKRLLVDPDDPKKLVLIFDLGGGALEVSLHEVDCQENQGMPNITPIARSHNTQVGGNDFDELLARHFEAYKPESTDKNYLDSLFVDDYQKACIKNAFRRYAEEAKIDLSRRIEFEKKMSIWDPDRPPDRFTLPTIIRKPFAEKAFRYEGFSLEQYERIINRFLAPGLSLDAVDLLDEYEKIINGEYEKVKVINDKREKIIDNPFRGPKGPRPLDEVDRRDINCFLPVDSSLDTTKNLPKDNDNIIYPILDVLKKGKDVWKKDQDKLPQVDVVLLNGGMTKLHTIQKRLETLFKSPKLEKFPKFGTNSDGAVARGAVVFHYNSKQPGFRPPKRILQEKVRIEIAQKRRYSPPAGLDLPKTWEKSKDLDVAVEATSVKVIVAYCKGSPNSSERLLFEKWEDEFLFKPLKKEDITISIRQLSISEHGILNIEAHPKGNPDRKDVVEIDLEALWQEKSTRRTDSGLKSLDTQKQIRELTRNFKQLQQTNSLHRQERILNRIEGQKSIIVQSSNAGEFVVPLCNIVLSLRKRAAIGKMLAIDLLSNLATKCSYKQCLFIYEVVMKLMADGRTHLKSVVQSAVWALGKIGSREKKTTLQIQHLDSGISRLMEQLGTSCHDDIKRNCIYALAEICDRRRCARDTVDSGTAAEVILLLVTFLIDRMHEKLSDSTSSELRDKAQETALLAIQMIRGIDLSPDEEETLRSIREKN